MIDQKIIECVPNFSEGRDLEIIRQITDEIDKTEGVKLLDVDPGKATNRTVVTFVGQPEFVIEAAFQAIKKASEVIDMSKHSGEHPRMGATDVCPMIPISNVSMEEAATCAQKLGERVGKELNIPIYLYEEAASDPKRKNLATVRSGEYEGLEKKLKNPEWKPDFGPAIFNKKAGATAIGARDFLVAYNINLNTTSTRRANSVAFDLREKGRVKREGDTLNGKIVRDENGTPLRVPGKLKAVKAIGWYIEEYGIAQVSMNLTDIRQTPLHVAFDEAEKSAIHRGIRITGSELVGLVPKKVLLEAGKFFLRKQQRSIGIAEEEIIKIAIKSLGLDELKPFDPRKKIIEYLLEDTSRSELVRKTIEDFVLETASESPAPGGGSISATVGSLGTALGTMVANLSSHKRGWDDKWEFYSDWAEKGQVIQRKLLYLVDEDTHAFNKIIDAIRLPKSTVQEKKIRLSAIEEATKYAINVPFDIMRTAHSALNLLNEMAEKGNPNSASDVGVGALCIKTAGEGAYMNVMINCKDLEDENFVKSTLSEAQTLLGEIKTSADRIIDKVYDLISE